MTRRLIPALIILAVVGAFAAYKLMGARHTNADLSFHVTNVKQADFLLMRERPGAAKRRVGSIPHDGRDVHYLGEEDRVGNSDWKKVKYVAIGWVNSRYLQIPKSESQPGVPDAFEVTNVSEKDVLVIRERPGATERQVGSIPSDGRDILYVAGTASKAPATWMKVQYQMVGWVNARYLIEAASESPIVASNTDRRAFAEGNHHFAAEQFDLAERDYSAAIAARADASYYLSRGNARFALLRYDDAKQDYDRAIEMQADHAPAYLSRGTLYWIEAALASAEADFRSAIRLEPENDFYYGRLAVTLIEQDRNSEATDMYRQAFESDPSRDWALNGWLDGLYAEKRFDDILSIFSQWRSQGVYAGWLYYYAARVHSERKDTDSALEGYYRALEHDPKELLPIEIYSEMATLERESSPGQCDAHLAEYQRRMGRPDYDKQWCYK